MIRLVDVWTQVEILAPHLGWSHSKELLNLENEIQRQFYAEMCRGERWSARTLRERVRGVLFERRAILRKPGEVARQELSEAARANAPHARRPCYSAMSACLDFLGLKDESIENALETAILRELERFLLELGTDHAFTWPRLPLKRKNEKRPSLMLRSWDMRDCRSIIARAGSRPIQWEGTVLGISQAPIVWISADGPHLDSVAVPATG